MSSIKMKLVKSFAFIICCLLSCGIFAQTPQSIEADLLKSFKKIRYDNPKNDEANLIFAKELKYYTEKYPFTIKQKFLPLETENLSISTSSDGLLRIYSWDTLLGGTMHIYNDLIQYNVHSKTYSTSYKNAANEDDNGNVYGDIYTLKVNGNIYYLATYSGVYDSNHWGVGIRIFSIADGRLNKNVKIIKTEDGLSNDVGWYCDESSIDSQNDVAFHYDKATRKIYVPAISDSKEKYNGYVIYKFTGRYFEIVKN